MMVDATVSAAHENRDSRNGDDLLTSVMKIGCPSIVRI